MAHCSGHEEGAYIGGFDKSFRGLLKGFSSEALYIRADQPVTFIFRLRHSH